MDSAEDRPFQPLRRVAPRTRPPLVPRATPDLVRIATAQHGAVSSAQLFEIGYSAASISRLVRAGQLHPEFRGVFSVGHRRLSRTGIIWAATLAGGEACALGFQSATEVQQLGLSLRTPQLIVATGQRRSQPGLVIHRTTTLPAEEVILVNGLRSSSPSRTLLDLGSVLPAHRLDTLLDTMIRKRVLDRRAMAASFAARPRVRGTAPLRAAIARLNENAGKARSTYERKTTRLCTQFGIPLPRINAIVEGFEVDLSWLDSWLIVEFDSGEFHCTPADFVKEELRDAALRRAGYFVHRIDAVDLSRLKHQTAADIARLRAQYAIAR